MMRQPDPRPFERYVANAAGSRNTVARLIAGALIVVVAAILGALALMAAGSFALGFGWLPEAFSRSIANGGVFRAFLESRAFIVVALLSIGGFWPGVWLALRFLHGRRLRSVIGAHGRLSRGDFATAFAVTLLVMLLGTLAVAPFDPTLQRSAMPLGAWLLALPVLLLVLLIQTSAEELFFRGYLLQGLAARFRSPWIWAVVPGLLFTFLHWDPSAQPLLLAVVLFSIGLFTLVATLLVYRTGNLGAGMGMHFANNIAAFLVLSADQPDQAIALFVGRPIEDPGWTTAEIMALAVAQTVMLGIVSALLVHPKSPVRVKAKGVLGSPSPEG